ncbi:hypothetical protein [Mesonia aestuariivivens]|uniref:Uncharacterized protein n=1 Tax=Mesonia aestuariivivens TaxID=2796128 RepID=A0ABS6W196_9FLAO|nr:hypothetical protein [Mesonia aestuariivivens]MBW2961307.1 hypothetical protein [Mesonia aestuariivivens]
MSDQLEEAQKNRDNDLKIAILNFLSTKEQPLLNLVLKHKNNPIPKFEEIFNYIKSL